jgi:hypothetical protein
VNDAAQVALTILSSGVVAAGVSGILNMRADARRERRDDDALRRHVRAAAHALATRVVMARQFGFTNVSSLTSSLAYLEEISKDRAIEKALSDKGSRALHESVDLCQTFIKFSRDRGIDPESSLSEWSPDEREKKQNLFSHAAKPTFDKLREYFAEDGSSDIVAEFDKGEEARAELERIRRGL